MASRPLPLRRRPLAVALGLALAAVGMGASPACALRVRAWIPPESLAVATPATGGAAAEADGRTSDSLVAVAAGAIRGFKASHGDSASGENYAPFERVGLAVRRMLREHGPGHLLGAPAIGAALDSLGLDVDLIVDPAQPSFALLMVRNPYRYSAEAVGFLYWWYRGQDLRMQGAVFRGGKEPAMRVWWEGRPDRPYEWAVIDRERGGGTARLTLFRLSPSGTTWNLVPDDPESPVLGEPGEAVFADLDHDGRPEIVEWAIPKTDSLFVPCPDCPRIMSERLFVLRDEGFALADTRVMPSPYATLVTFVRLILDGRRGEAARLVRDPQMVTDAVAAGWAVKRAAGTWQVEYGEQGERWPRWLEVRFAGPQGVKRYIVHFGQREGRWIIEQWLEPQPAARPSGARSR
jgi:hypothetical protein